MTLEIKEWFQNREDTLQLRHINKSTGLNIDYFKPGHPQALRGEQTPLPGRLDPRVWQATEPVPASLSKSDVWKVRGSAEDPGKCDKCPSRKVKNQGHLPILWLGLGTQWGPHFQGVRMLSNKTNNCPHKGNADGRIVAMSPRGWEVREGHAFRINSLNQGCTKEKHSVNIYLKK